MSRTGSRESRPKSTCRSHEYQLVLIEPLLERGYAVWPLPKAPTIVGFTEDCHIVLPLSHVSGDLKFNEWDKFIIEFRRETQEWSMAVVVNDIMRGGFKKIVHPANSRSSMDRGKEHLTLPPSGGCFTYALRYVSSLSYLADYGETSWWRRGVLRFRIMKVSNVDSTSYLHMLPALVLGRVASYLSKEDLFDGLLSAYPGIGGKIRHSICWQTIGDELCDPSFIELLDVLRCLMLTSVESTVKFIVSWKPEDGATYRKWRRLLASPYLRSVIVLDPRVLRGEKLSDRVRTLRIMLPDALRHRVIWQLFDKNLFVPASLEQLEIEPTVTDAPARFQASLAIGGAEFNALFSDVPKLHFVVNPRPEFWDDFTTFDNTIELSLPINRWSKYRAPLDEFSNLRKLRIDMSGVLGRNFFDFDAVLPRLRTVELVRVGKRGFGRNGLEFLEDLARLAPNVTTLTITSDWSSEVSHPDAFAVTIPERFTCLRKLKVVDFDLKLNAVKDMIDCFEEVRPGGLKEVIVDGIVYYARPRCHDVCAGFARWVKRLRRQNRDFKIDFGWSFHGVEKKGHYSPPNGWIPPMKSRYSFKFSQP